MEEEGDPKDPVVEATLDQALGNRKCGLGGLLTDYPTLKYANPDDEQDIDCDVYRYVNAMYIKIASMVARV